MTTTGAYDVLVHASRRTLDLFLPSRYLLNQWVEVCILACVYTLLLLLFMKVAGFGGRVGTIRRDMLREAYRILLYRRCLRVVLRAEMTLVWSNLKLLFFLLPTLLFGTLVAAGGYDFLAERYACRPVAVGEEFVVRARAVRRGLELKDCEVQGLPPSVEKTARVRSPDERTVWTRLAAHQPGVFGFGTGGGSGGASGRGATVNVGRPDRPVRRWQYTGGLELYVDYGSAHERGRGHGWVVAFVAVCFASAVPLGRALSVRV
jgi:hypothetical protein